MGKDKIIAISGSFDPLHTGHLAFIKQAKSYGDKLVVILKGDNRLKRKKGNYLLPQEERKEILMNTKFVDKVYIHDTPDYVHHSDIEEALSAIMPDLYCAGAEVNESAIEACKKLGIPWVILGGEKVNSSSKLLDGFLSRETYKEIANVMPIMCVDAIIVHNGKYLLVKRKNNPLKGQYWLPGGRVLKNERLEDALHRKVKEEVGLRVKILSTAGFYEDFYKENELGIDSVHTTAVVFLVSPIDSEINLDEHGEDYIWSDKLPDNLNLNVARYL